MNILESKEHIIGIIGINFFLFSLNGSPRYPFKIFLLTKWKNSNQVLGWLRFKEENAGYSLSFGIGYLSIKIKK